MSFLDRIRAVNRHDLGRFRRFEIGGERIGWVKHDVARTLARWPEVFSVDEQRVGLAPSLDAPATPPYERTRAVERVLRALRDEGFIDGWRDELYPVNRRWQEPPLMLIERASAPLFGVGSYAVHINGFVGRGRDMRMWIGRRSHTKAAEPNKLDQLVAGGQPAGIGLLENAIKECAEEAGIPRSFSRGMVPAGVVTYAMETERGFRPDVIFVFDLELPADFEPASADGEMQAFYRWPMEKVIATVRDTDAFKLNCALVAIDFLVRHGFIAPDHPDYVDIVSGLRGAPVDG